MDIYNKRRKQTWEDAWNISTVCLETVMDGVRGFVYSPNVIPLSIPFFLKVIYFYNSFSVMKPPWLLKFQNPPGE